MRFSNVLLVVIAALMPFMGCGMPKVKTKSRAKKARTTVLAKPKATTKVTPKVQPKEARPQFTGEVTIAMTGDIMTGSILPTPNMPPNDGRDTFIDCAKLLQSADVACGNLEGVLGDSGKPRKAPGPLSFSFMMPTKSVQLLVDAGYDFLGIANNHINDFYPVAIQSTIKTLRDNGIGVAGTRDCETCIREINGVKYGFCAFGHESYTLRTQDKATVTRIVKKLRSECDIVIVCFHGGSEGLDQRHLPYGTEYFYKQGF